MLELVVPASWMVTLSGTVTCGGTIQWLPATKSVGYSMPSALL
jgi:hypothetical protein